MTDMFNSYEITPQSRKSPLCKKEIPIQQCVPKQPYEDYNAEGEFIGYWWNYGDTVNLQFDIEGDLTVENDSLILTAIGQEPLETEGFIGQKAYNVTDMKSWTCTSSEMVEGINIYTWTLDETFDNPADGQRNVYVDAANFLEDKKLIFTLYDFRNNVIDTRTFDGTPSITYEIDSEFSKKLIKGVYYGKLDIVDNTRLILTVFQQSDCTFTIK